MQLAQSELQQMAQMSENNVTSGWREEKCKRSLRVQKFKKLSTCPWSSCSQQVLLFRLFLSWLSCKSWNFLWTWRHLASFVEYNKENEDESTHHRVANDGCYGPNRQAHPQLVLHAGLKRKLQAPVVTSHSRGSLQKLGTCASIQLPNCSLCSPVSSPACSPQLQNYSAKVQKLQQTVGEVVTFVLK